MFEFKVRKIPAALSLIFVGYGHLYKCTTCTHSGTGTTGGLFVPLLLRYVALSLSVSLFPPRRRIDLPPYIPSRLHRRTHTGIFYSVCIGKGKREKERHVAGGIPRIISRARERASVYMLAARRRPPSGLHI